MKKFDDEYNKLFEQPLKHHVFPKKSLVKKSVSFRFGNRRIKAIWIVLLLLCLIILYRGRFYLYGLFQESNTETQEIYPLKEANIKQKGAIDLSNPLLVTPDNRTLKFNRNYQLNILGDPDIKLSSEELSVLPTKDKYVYEKSVSEVTFYDKNHDMDRYAEIAMSGNVVKSEIEYVEKNKHDFTKAYPQKNIGDVRWGYIVNYSKDSGYVDTEIEEYYIFLDGTGITIALNSNSEKELDKQDSFKNIKVKYKQDFLFLENHFDLKRQA